MNQQYERTVRIIGEDGINRLHKCSVLVFGVGGVGSYVCEGLARAGIGAITMVDKDVVDITNINRQIPALHSTIGKSKVEVMAARIRDIDPDCSVDTREMFFLPDKAERAGGCHRPRHLLSGAAGRTCVRDEGLGGLHQR